MTYVSGAVYAVPTNNKQKFIEFSKIMAPIFKEHGALTYFDCWGADVPEGEVTSFPMAVKLEEGETVCFSWMTFPDKQTSDTAMQKAMTDPRMPKGPMPFDGKRMIFGGFEVVVKA